MPESGTGTGCGRLADCAPRGRDGRPCPPEASGPRPPRPGQLQVAPAHLRRWQRMADGALGDFRLSFLRRCVQRHSWAARFSLDEACIGPLAPRPPAPVRVGGRTAGLWLPPGYVERSTEFAGCCHLWPWVSSRFASARSLSPGQPFPLREADSASAPAAPTLMHAPVTICSPGRPALSTWAETLRVPCPLCLPSAEEGARRGAGVPGRL